MEEDGNWSEKRFEKTNGGKSLSKCGGRANKAEVYLLISINFPDVRHIL
jgi:hypothetical protein